MQTILIDSCAWNYLFEKGVVLTDAFPRDAYILSIPREVEIELQAIPETEGKKALIAYIADARQKSAVGTDFVFGFASTEPDGSLSPVQTFGGFDQGTFQSSEEREFLDKPEVNKMLTSGRLKRKSGLGPDQTDAALASRSLSAIVLTAERKGKPGPLKIAAENNGRITYVSDIEESGLTIGDYFRTRIASQSPKSQSPT